MRQSGDGRTIVYGARKTDIPGEAALEGGELLEPEADIASALHRVARMIRADPALAEGCIAELPPPDLRQLWLRSARAPRLGRSSPTESR